MSHTKLFRSMSSARIENICCRTRLLRKSLKTNVQMKTRIAFSFTLALQAPRVRFGLNRSILARSTINARRFERPAGRGRCTFLQTCAKCQKIRRPKYGTPMSTANTCGSYGPGPKEHFRKASGTRAWTRRHSGGRSERMPKIFSFGTLFLLALSHCDPAVPTVGPS